MSPTECCTPGGQLHVWTRVLWRCAPSSLGLSRREGHDLDVCVCTQVDGLRRQQEAARVQLSALQSTDRDVAAEMEAAQSALQELEAGLKVPPACAGSVYGVVFGVLGEDSAEVRPMMRYPQKGFSEAVFSHTAGSCVIWSGSSTAPHIFGLAGAVCVTVELVAPHKDPYGHLRGRSAS